MAPVRRVHGNIHSNLYFKYISRLYTLLLCASTVIAFDNSRNDNVAVYWGQDSSGNQRNLSYYCQDDSVDAIPMAFLFVFFGQGGDPMIDFSNICSSSGNEVFPGTQLANCSFLAPDIEECQRRGKMVTLSLGGATGNVGFVSQSQAVSFADDIWNMFLGGTGDIRPLGSAVLDGIDLDIEGGLPDFYSDFVNRLRVHMGKSKKRYYVTAAPQCPFPDANLGEAISGAPFDAIYVQFYNNYCSLNHPDQFDFSAWDDWAHSASPNPNVKIYIGAPGSPSSAGQGYVDIAQLKSYAAQAQQNYSSFGGVMFWDASTAYENSRMDKAIKESMSANGKSNGGDGGNVPPSNPRGPGVGPQCAMQSWSTLEGADSGKLQVFSLAGAKRAYFESKHAVGALSSLAYRRISRALNGQRNANLVRRVAAKYKLTSHLHTGL